MFKKRSETTILQLWFRISSLKVYINDEFVFYRPLRDDNVRSGLDDVILLFRRFVSNPVVVPLKLEVDVALASYIYGDTYQILA